MFLSSSTRICGNKQRSEETKYFNFPRYIPETTVAVPFMEMSFNLFLSSVSYTKCFICFRGREIRNKMKVADKLRLVTAEETEQKMAKQFMERERNKDCKERAGLECFPGRSLLIQNSGDIKRKLHQNVRKKYL